MSSAEQAELNIAREHRLHSAPGDNVDQLRIEIVFAEDPLLLGDPERHRIAPDGAVGGHEFRRRFSGMTCSYDQAPRENYRQPPLLHSDSATAMLTEQFVQAVQIVQAVQAVNSMMVSILRPPALAKENFLCLLGHAAGIRINRARHSICPLHRLPLLNRLEPALEIRKVIQVLPLPFVQHDP